MEIRKKNGQLSFIFKRWIVKLFSNWPENLREKDDQEDNEDCWCYGFVFIPTIKIMQDPIHGKRIGAGFLFWGIDICLITGIYD